MDSFYFDSTAHRLGKAKASCGTQIARVKKKNTLIALVALWANEGNPNTEDTGGVGTALSRSLAAGPRIPAAIATGLCPVS